MIALRAVLQNNFYRLMEHKSRIWLLLGLTIGAVAAAVLLNNPNKPIGNIALVSESPTEITTPFLKITSLEESPPRSKLFLGQYDAVVTYSKDDSYQIETLKGEGFRKKVEAILTNPLDYAPDSTGIRQIGTSIVGFLTMFILMQGVSTMYLFAEDKEHEQIKRIAASPVPLSGYLLGHSIFTFLFLLIPTLLVICVVKYICRIPVGFNFFEYLLLLSAICALATAFALFLQAAIQNGDSANMIGSATVILTSILAGSFYSFEGNNRALSVITSVLPQKLFLTLAEQLEKHSETGTLLPYLAGLAAITLLFSLSAGLMTNKTYRWL